MVVSPFSPGGCGTGKGKLLLEKYCKKEGWLARLDQALGSQPLICFRPQPNGMPRLASPTRRVVSSCRLV